MDNFQVDIYALASIPVAEGIIPSTTSAEFAAPLPMTVEMMTSGIKGDPGGQDIIYPAGEILAAHKAVSLNSLGKLVYTDVSDLFLCQTFIGVTLQAGDAGAFLQLRTFGEITDSSLTFDANKNIFVTSSGTLTSTKPTATRYLCIGISYNTNSFYLNKPLLWEEEI